MDEATNPDSAPTAKNQIASQGFRVWGLNENATIVKVTEAGMAVNILDRVEATTSHRWQQGLCVKFWQPEYGGWGQCLFACFCPCVYWGQTKAKFDSTNTLENCCSWFGCPGSAMANRKRMEMKFGMLQTGTLGLGKQGRCTDMIAHCPCGCCACALLQERREVEYWKQRARNIALEPRPQASISSASQ